MNSEAHLIADDAVTTNTSDSDLARMLGIPPSEELKGPMAELASSTRHWFQENVSPWSVRRYYDIEAIDEDSVLLTNGVRLNSPELARRFAPAQAHGVVVIALSLGSESENEATDRLNAGLPDEWIAIDAYASALVETIRREECLKVCTWADGNDATALALYAPGYEGWPLSDQQVLYDLLDREEDLRLDDRLQVHPESHMILPIKSNFLVVGITHQTNVARMNTAHTIPCTSCAHPTCTMRRAPYQELENWLSAEVTTTKDLASDLTQPTAKKAPGDHEEWKYTFPEKALKRWATQLLTMKVDEDEKTHALFKLEGSICRHSNKRLVFDLEVTLAPPSDGHRILAISCVAAEEDESFETMCGAAALDKFVQEVEEHQPLVGEPLARTFDWKPQTNPGGCICLEAHRNAKWLMVYQTILYALEKKR